MPVGLPDNLTEMFSGFPQCLVGQMSGLHLSVGKARLLLDPRS